MCDFSLQAVQSRAARVGDKLKSRDFGTGTRGFGPADGDKVAICVLPGTEIAFDAPIAGFPFKVVDGEVNKFSVAIFRQVDLAISAAHHDALELPDGTIVKLNDLAIGQTATVLQLPAAPKTEAEEKEQTRLVVVG